MVEKAQKTTAKATRTARERTAPEDPAAVKQEIADTRADLGDTVDAIAAKADVTSRAKESAVRGGRALRAGGGRLMDRTGQVAGKARDALPDAPRRIARNAVRLMRLQPKKVAAIGLGGAAAVAVVWRLATRRRR
ncbi:MAG TPA: DUF3618 domain-containing protein [Streptosporangiaceae bacterium]|jgi:hypothetical protein